MFVYRSRSCLVYLLFYVVVVVNRVMFSVSMSQSRDIPTSRLGLILRKIVNVSLSSRSREADVSVSAIYISCPKPIFRQIVQATVRSVNGL